MADFAIQRGQATIADTGTTVTITAGSEYTAPSALTKAFIRIVSTAHKGTQGTNANVTQANNDCWISNPANLLTSITFTRYGSSGAVTINWEIIEYTGAVGGANEFVVLGQGAQALATTENAATTGATTAPTTDADVVAFLTGQGANTPSVAGMGDGLHSLAWNAAGDTITGTRDRVNNNASTFSWAAVEFKGSNWGVQRVSHTITAAGATETEAITDVGSLARAFIHPQFHVNSDICADAGLRIWLSGTAEVSFLEDGAGVALATGVAWVIRNSQTDGTPLKVTRYTDSGLSAATENVAVTAVGAMAETTIEELTATTPQTTSSHALEIVAARLTTTTNVEIRRSRWDVGDSIATRFATVEWPTVAAGGSLGFSQPRFVSGSLF